MRGKWRRLDGLWSPIEFDFRPSIRRSITNGEQREHAAMVRDYNWKTHTQTDQKSTILQTDMFFIRIVSLIFRCPESRWISSNYHYELSKCIRKHWGWIFELLREIIRSNPSYRQLTTRRTDWTRISSSFSVRSLGFGCNRRWKWDPIGRLEIEVKINYSGWHRRLKELMKDELWVIRGTDGARELLVNDLP